MKQPDWSKAPEWATLYLQHISDSRATAWAESYEHGARVITPERNEMFGLIPQCWLVVCRRPAPQWNGEGRPPVGVVCEFLWNYLREGSEYVKARVLAHDEDLAVLRVIGGESDGELREGRSGYCGYIGNEHPIFRPIRTPEQIASEEREAAVEVMMSRFALRDITEVPWYALFQQMYDAGCRMTAEDKR